MGKIIEVKVNLNGIYTMSDSPWLVPGAHLPWDNYFKNQRFNDGTPWIFWKTHTSEHGTTFLTNIVGGGMIHPMDGFHVFFGKTYQIDDFTHEIAELKRIFTEVAEACGGTCKALVQEHEVEKDFFCNRD